MDLYRSFETNLKSISIKCSFLIPWMSMFNLTISSKNNTLLLLLACSWWCSCVPCTCYIAVCGCWQGVCGGCCQYKEEFGISFSFLRTIFRPIINTHVILVVRCDCWWYLQTYESGDGEAKQAVDMNSIDMNRRFMLPRLQFNMNCWTHSPEAYL